MSRFLIHSLAALIVSTAVTVHAHDDEANASSAEQSESAGKPTIDGEKPTSQPTGGAIEKRSEKEDGIPLDDQGMTLSYLVEAAMMPMNNAKGEEQARIFHTYYHVTAGDSEERPIVFCFNGGPGASSVWLHLGGIGPYRVNTPDHGTDTSAPPFDMVANPHTLLRSADLVFVDPVSTGYSRGKDKKSASQFHGFKDDIAGNAEFIRKFIAHHELWNRPVFLLGESYGVIRVSALAEALSDKFGIRTNGLMLISGLLDFQTLQSTPTNDLPYALALPTFTRVAIHHGILTPQNPQQLIDEARAFANSDYINALHQGLALDADSRKQIIDQLHRFTGVESDWINRSNLRISPYLFRGLLLRESDQIIGRFDARVTSRNPDPTRSGARHDPSFAVLSDAYTTMIQKYLVSHIGFGPNNDHHYRTLTSKVHPWSYAPYENRFTETIDSLNDTLLANPRMRVFVAAGKFDLATPFEGIEHSLRRIHFPSETSLTHRMYDGGHMMYSNPTALEQLGSDLRNFVTKSTDQP